MIKSILDAGLGLFLLVGGIYTAYHYESQLTYFQAVTMLTGACYWFDEAKRDLE
jgi:hypothetical protein